MSVNPTGRHEVIPAADHSENNPAFIDLELLATQLSQRHHREDNKSLRYGAGMLLFAGALTTAVALGRQTDTDDKLVTDVPFVPVAQEVVESIDDVLSTAGSILLPLSVGAIAGAKIGGRYSPLLRSADLASSQELTDDGKRRVAAPRRFLRSVAAGSIPAIATTAVGVGSVMASVGEEISTGPSRPIETMFDSIPGDGELQVVVQDAAASPMLESNISRELTGRIVQEADARGVQATPVDLFLPSITYEELDLSALVVGSEQEQDSPLLHDTEALGCEGIPIAVDSAADIPVSSTLEISGVPAVVVDERSGTSAINRIGVEVSREVYAACFEKNPQAPDDMVVLSTDAQTAQEIFDAANEGLGEPATVISDNEYIQNSEDFWTANSKPVTNVLALMSTGLAFVSMAGIAGARMLRNRREWATKLAQGVSDNQLRLTELLRAVKDGTVASVVGVTGATLVAPAINFLESGLRVGMDFRSAMVGCAVGIIGSVGGTLHKVLRPRKTIDPAEHTRI